MMKIGLLLLRLIFFSARLASGLNKPEAMRPGRMVLPGKITCCRTRNGLMPFQEAQQIVAALMGLTSFFAAPPDNL